MLLINNKLFFDPERRKLTSGDNSVLLTENMSRCLMVLLINKGEVVTKHTLLKEVWEKNGVIVTDTSIRQTLSQLRKAISNLDIEEDIILTLPRQGYKLVSPVTEESAPLSILLPTPDDIVPETQDTTVFPPSSDTPRISPRRKPFSLGSRFNRSLLLGVVVLMILGVGGTLAYVKFFFIYNLEYITVSENAIRKIIVAESLHSDNAYIAGAMHRFDDFVAKGVILTPKTYSVYINKTVQPETFSYFVCENPQGTPENCQSLFIHSGQTKW